MVRRSPQGILAQNVAGLLAAQNRSFEELGAVLGWNAARMAELKAGAFDAQLDDIDALAQALNALPMDLLVDFEHAPREMEFAR